VKSLVKSSEPVETIVRRVRERARRERLHREIGALESKLAKVIDHKRFNWNARAWKMTSKLKRLRAQLAQPELFL
jgi:hypothetical protein